MSKPVVVTLDDDDAARWRWEAERRGWSLTFLVRESVNLVIPLLPEPPKVDRAALKTDVESWLIAYAEGRKFP
jgi:hypothetical protein